MDFNKLAKVADSINGKERVTAEGRIVVDTSNPLDALEERSKITDSAPKVVFVDNRFLRKLAKSPRSERRKFISRLTDSQKRRVLEDLKRIKDSGFSEKLGYILLDDLLANAAFDPSKSNIQNLDEFVDTQEYFELSDNMLKLINQIKEGDVDLDKSALEELKSGMQGRESRLASMSSSDDEEEFELPKEEELTEEDKTSLRDSAKKHVAIFKKNKNFREVTDAADELIAEFQSNNRSYAETSDEYWKAFDEEWKEQFKGDDIFETIDSKEIADAIDAALDIIDDENDSKLDDVFDNPAKDANGNEVKEYEERSVLELFSEALDEYIDGDPEKLDELSKQTMADETETEEEPDEEEDVDITEDETEVKDAAIKMSRRILAGKKVDKLVDAFTGKVKALERVNFKTTDCVLPNHECQECEAINMPLTCEEYNELHKPELTPVMLDVIKSCEGFNCGFPPVQTVEVTPEGLINVNNGKLCVSTIPVDEFEERLKAAEDKETLSEIVNGCSVSVEDAMKAAAMCDNLNYIDTKFFKPSIGASHWEFDEENKPACLIECPPGHCIERCGEDKANYHLFGVPFVVS